MSAEISPNRLEMALALDRSESDVFRAAAPIPPPEQVYGGHLVGQALHAAARTVEPDRRPHSLHTYFLRPGRPGTELKYNVQRTREGSSFSTRSVDVEQTGTRVAQVSASFVGLSGGVDHQATMPTTVMPDELPTLSQLVDTDPCAWSQLYRCWDHFDVRYLVPPRARLGCDPIPTGAQVWLRTREPQPDDAVWNACALAYVSDLTLLSVTLPVQRLRPALPGLRMASLDHTVWFHRPCRVDEWLLYDQTTTSTSGSLGLASGRIFTVDGKHVATVMQEGLVRMSQPEEVGR